MKWEGPSSENGDGEKPDNVVELFPRDWLDSRDDPIPLTPDAQQRGRRGDRRRAPRPRPPRRVSGPVDGAGGSRATQASEPQSPRHLTPVPAEPPTTAVGGPSPTPVDHAFTCGGPATSKQADRAHRGQRPEAARVDNGTATPSAPRETPAPPPPTGTSPPPPPTGTTATPPPTGTTALPELMDTTAAPLPTARDPGTFEPFLSAQSFWSDAAPLLHAPMESLGPEAAPDQPPEDEGETLRRARPRVGARHLTAAAVLLLLLSLAGVGLLRVDSRDRPPLSASRGRAERRTPSPTARQPGFSAQLIVPETPRAAHVRVRPHTTSHHRRAAAARQRSSGASVPVTYTSVSATVTGSGTTAGYSGTATPEQPTPQSSGAQPTSQTSDQAPTSTPTQQHAASSTPSGPQGPGAPFGPGTLN